MDIAYIESVKAMRLGKEKANESSTMDHSDSGDYQDDRADHAAETDSKGHGSEG